MKKKPKFYLNISLGAPFYFNITYKMLYIRNFWGDYNNQRLGFRISVK